MAVFSFYMGLDRLTLAVAGIDRPPLALLVDRDADTRHMYADFLRTMQCETEEAGDGREALAKAMTRHPDVIVAETRLPGMSGYDLCRLIRDDPHTRDIPFLFVTASAFEQDVKRANAAGADAVLVKPCLPEELARAIEIAIERADRLRQLIAGLPHKANVQLEHSQALPEESTAIRNRSPLNRQPQGRDATAAPSPPPALVCPQCGQPLRHIRTHVGGVARHPEQWDYFECGAGCGTFRYRHRTCKLRRV
jgi:CheY-like chemotaxis protein